MKAYPWLLAVAGIALDLATNTARAFSIEAVTFSPSNAVAPMVELKMHIDIITPSGPTALYAPTQVSANESGIHVEVYPTSGLLPVIGFLRETVVLGTFPVGTYDYEVQIHPDFFVGWGTRTNRGSFSILPRLEVSGSAQEVVLRWPSAASNYVLEVTTALPALGGWSPVTNPVVRIGAEHVVTNRALSAAQFYRLRRP
jgi:hypothetical protein